MLNRTRLYVPARTLWGALTAELARAKVTNFPDYQQIGEKLQREARLSYLYPAEEIDGKWQVWLPLYQEDTGLVWEREDGKVEVERRFRMRLLITRPGTAIEPESDTAAEGTLREFELISPYWWDDRVSPRPVALVGYIFYKDAALLQELEPIQTLWVGGDIRYGLGRLDRVAWESADSFFGEKVDLRGEEPEIQTSRVLAHTRPPGGSTSLVGAMECLGGWDMPTGGMKTQDLTWAPGSRSKGACNFVVQKEGLWVMQ
ncbi:MAG: hypothetical protein QN121_12545 [Armatimonadota bacterium]|nr:hypothetical protein [Armatimonadota bacterium]